MLEKELKHLDLSKILGLWDFSTYLRGFWGNFEDFFRIFEKL